MWPELFVLVEESSTVKVFKDGSSNMEYDHKQGPRKQDRLFVHEVGVSLGD